MTGSAPRQSSRKTLLLAGAGLAVIVVVGLLCISGLYLLASRSTPSGAGPGQPASRDVMLRNCSSRDGYSAELVVKNSTDRARDYTITVTFIGMDGTQVARDVVSIRGLPAGETALKEASAPSRGLMKDCRVTSVTRI